jgi:hypothetical protein
MRNHSAGLSFALLLSVLVSVPAHAREHVCETSSVHVSIDNLTPDRDTPNTYSFRLKLIDSCPEDDELEGVFVSVEYSWVSTDCRDNKSMGDGSILEHEIIEPSKSHRTLWDPESLQIPPNHELMCIWIGNVQVTGSYHIQYTRDGSEKSRY